MNVGMHTPHSMRYTPPVSAPSPVHATQTPIIDKVNAVQRRSESSAADAAPPVNAGAVQRSIAAYKTPDKISRVSTPPPLSIQQFAHLQSGHESPYFL